MKLLVLVLLALSATFALARDLDFALDYRGSCVYDEKTGYCQLKAQSQQITTTIKGTGDVQTSVKRLIGSISHLEFAELFNTTTGQFDSLGTLSFGVHSSEKDHMLNFAGSGTVRNSPNPDGEYAFAVVWKVTKGFGVFEKAVGTITANGVWDRQTQEAAVGVVGVLWYP